MTLPRIATIAAVSLILALGGAGTASAGSVFLKNGYILQGRIVERGEGVVVLGWQNGRVTIHDRFIDEVLLDPAEEEMIRRKKELEAAEKAETALAMENFDLASNEVISLPDNYETILGRSASTTMQSPIPGTTPGTSTQSPIPSTTPQTHVGTLPNPSELEKLFPALGIALQVPNGWKVQESGDGLRVETDAATGSVKLTIDVWRRGALEPDVAMSAIAESLTATFPTAAIEHGSDVEVGGIAAKSLVFRDSERRAACRQHVVSTASGVYVVGMYFPFDADTATALALDDMLDSIRFLFE